MIGEPEPANGASDPPTAAVTRLGVSDILELRQHVLRRGTPVSHAHYAEDEDPTVVHLGIVQDGRVTATSTWLMRRCPEAPDDAAMQLKGMAVADELQGRGLGRMLLAEGLLLARERGALVVWARARDSALGFYETCGFEIAGPAFIDDATGLSHHVVLRRL